MKYRIDPKSLDSPNICFSLIEKGDNREKKFEKQRLKRGFDDSETWDFRYTVAKFILPRLKRYYKLADKMLVLSDKGRKDIKLAIKAFETIIYVEDEAGRFMKDKEVKIINKGLKAFGKVYLSLWW